MTPRLPIEISAELHTRIGEVAASGSLPELKALLGRGKLLTNGQVLLEHRKKVNLLLARQGGHPIQLAAKNGHMQTTLWLAQQCGCQWEQDVASGLRKNTLHILAENGHIELLELLLRLPIGYQDTTLLFFQTLYQLGASDFDYYVIPEHRALLFDERYFPHLVENAIKNGKEDVLVWFAQKDPDLFDECDEVIYKMLRDCRLETIVGVLEVIGFLDENKLASSGFQSAQNLLLKSSNGVHVYYELIDQKMLDHNVEKIKWVKKNFVKDPLTFLETAGVCNLLLNYSLPTIKSVFESLGLIDEGGLIKDTYKSKLIEIVICECERDESKYHTIVRLFHPRLCHNPDPEKKEWVTKNFAQQPLIYLKAAGISDLLINYDLPTIKSVFESLGLAGEDEQIKDAYKSKLIEFVINECERNGYHIIERIFHPKFGHEPDKIKWMMKNFAQEPLFYLKTAGVCNLLINYDLSTIKSVFDSLGLTDEDGLIKDAFKSKLIEIVISECERDGVDYHIFDHIVRKRVPSQAKEIISWLEDSFGILDWPFGEKLPLLYTSKYLSLAELKKILKKTGALDSKGNILPFTSKWQNIQKALTDDEGLHVLHHFFSGESSDESLEKIEWMVSFLGCSQRDSQGRTPLYEAVLHGELSQVKMIIDRLGCLSKEQFIHRVDVKKIESLLIANDGDNALHTLIKRRGDEATEKITWLCQNLGVEWRDEQDVSTLRLASEYMSVDSIKEIVKVARYANQAGVIYPYMKESLHELLRQRTIHLYEKILGGCKLFYEVGEEEKLTEGANLLISRVRVFGIDYSPGEILGYQNSKKLIPMLLERPDMNFKTFLTLLDGFGFLDKNGNLFPGIVKFFTEQLNTIQPFNVVYSNLSGNSLLKLWFMKQVFLNKIETPYLKLQIIINSLILKSDDFINILTQRSMLQAGTAERLTMFRRSDTREELVVFIISTIIFSLKDAFFSSGFSVSEMKAITVERQEFELMYSRLSESFTLTAKGMVSDAKGVAKLSSFLDRQSLLDVLINNLDVETIRKLIDRGDEVPCPTIEVQQILETDTEKVDVLSKYLQAHLVVNSMCLHYLQRIEQELKEERPYSRLLHQLFDELIIAQSKWPMIDHVLFLPEVKQRFESIKDLMEEKELTPQFYLKWVLSSYAIYSPWAEPLLSKKQVIEDDRRYGWLVPSVEAVEAVEVVEEAVEEAEAEAEAEEAVEEAEEAVEEAKKVEPPTHNTTEYVRTVLEYSEAHPADFTTLATEVGDEKWYLLDEQTVRRILCRAVDAEGELHQLELKQSLVQLLFLTADRLQFAAFNNRPDFEAPPCKEYEVRRQATNRQLNQQSFRLMAIAIQLLLDSRPKERPEPVASQPAYSEFLHIEWEDDAVDSPEVIDFEFLDKAPLTDAQFISEKINESDVLRNLTRKLFPLFFHEQLTDSPSSMEEESMEEEHRDKSAEEEMLFNHNNIHHVEKLLRCVAQVLNLEPAMETAPQAGPTSRQSGYVPRKKDCDAPLERPGVDSDFGVTGAGAAAGPGIRYRK